MSSKNNGWSGCLIVMSLFWIIPLLIVIFNTCCRQFYSPDKLDGAIANGDFERVHKILNKMSNDEEYSKEEFHLFKKNGESEYSKQCRKAFTAEVIYLIKEGAFDRIENVATLYPNGLETLPDLISSQSSNIYRHLDEVNETSLIMLCKYLPSAGIVANYVTRNPTAGEIVNFMRKIPYNAPSPITGHVEDQHAILSNLEFIQATNNYNEACDVAMEFALNRQDEDLCNIIISLYKSNISQRLVKGHTFSEDEYEVSYSDNHKERAFERMKSLSH